MEQETLQTEKEALQSKKEQFQIVIAKGHSDPEDEEKRKAGLPIGSSSAAGAGAALAAGGAGAGGAAVGGAGLGGTVLGGLLATKAGIVALIVAGTTVAGGLGLIGYKVSVRNEAARLEAERQKMLFAAHPKQAAQDLEGVDAEQKLAAIAKGDAASSSLQFVADANETLPLDRVEKTEEKKEASDANSTPPAPPAPDPGDAAKAAAVAAAGTPPPANNNAPSFGPAAKMAFSTKIGQLSTNTGGGASGAHFGASGTIGSAIAMDPSKLLASVAKPGTATAMAGGPKAFLGNGKGVGAAGRRGGAIRQLGNVLNDQRGAVNSADAGRTYDGGARGGGTTGASQGGATTAAPDSNPNANAPGGNSSNGAGLGPSPLPAAPDDAAGKNVTPWQGQMNMAKALMGGAIAGLAIGWMICKAAQATFNSAAMAVKAAMAVVDDSIAGPQLQAAAKAMHLAALQQKAAIALFAAAGLAMLGALAIGVHIMGGEYGQLTAGLSFALGGGFGAMAAGLAVKSLLPSLAQTEAAATFTDAYGDTVTALGQLEKNPYTAEAAKSVAQAEKSLANYHAMTTEQVNNGIHAIVEEQIQPLGTAPLLMGVCGAAAVVAFGVSMITSPKEVPQRDCPNHRCHDLSFYPHGDASPSPDVLAAYLG